MERLSNGNLMFFTQDTVDSMYEAWKKLAFQEGHIVSSYSSASSWGFIYTLFYDKMLHFGVVDDEVYNAQDAFYKSRIVDVNVAAYGITFDSLSGQVSARMFRLCICQCSLTDCVRVAWNMLTAAATNDTQVRDKLISQVRAKMYSNGTTKGVFPSMYGSQDTPSKDTHSAR